MDRYAQPTLTAAEKLEYKEYCQNLRDVFADWAKNVGTDAPSPRVESLIKLSWETCLADRRKLLEGNRRQETLEKRLVGAQKAYFQEVVMLRDRIRGLMDQEPITRDGTTFYEPLKYLDEHTRELCQEIIAEQLKLKEELQEVQNQEGEKEEKQAADPEEDHPVPAEKEGSVVKQPTQPAIAPSPMPTTAVDTRVFQMRGAIEELEREKDDHGKEKRRWQMSSQRQLDDFEHRRENWERELFQMKQNLSSVMMENKALTLANRRLRDHKAAAEAIQELVASTPPANPDPDLAPLKLSSPEKRSPSKEKSLEKVSLERMKRSPEKKCAEKKSPEKKSLTKKMSALFKKALEEVNAHKPDATPAKQPVFKPSSVIVKPALSKPVAPKFTAPKSKPDVASTDPPRSSAPPKPAVPKLVDEDVRPAADAIEKATKKTEPEVVAPLQVPETALAAEIVAKQIEDAASSAAALAAESAKQEVLGAAHAAAKQAANEARVAQNAAVEKAANMAEEAARRKADDIIARVVDAAAKEAEEATAKAVEVTRAAMIAAATAAADEVANDRDAEKQALLALLQNAERQIQEFTLDMHRQRRMDSTIQSSNGFHRSLGDAFLNPSSSRGLVTAQITSNSFFQHSSLGFRISDDLQNQLNRTEQRLRTTKDQLGISELHREEAEGLLTALEREVHDLEFSLKKHHLNLTDTNWAKQRNWHDDKGGREAEKKMRHTVYSIREKGYEKRRLRTHREHHLRQNLFQNPVPQNTPDVTNEDTKSDLTGWCANGANQGNDGRESELTALDSGTNLESVTNLESASVVRPEEIERRSGTDSQDHSDDWSQTRKDSTIHSVSLVDAKTDFWGPSADDQKFDNDFDVRSSPLETPLMQHSRGSLMNGNTLSPQRLSEIDAMDSSSHTRIFEEPLVTSRIEKFISPQRRSEIDACSPPETLEEPPFYRPTSPPGHLHHSLKSDFPPGPHDPYLPPEMVGREDDRDLLFSTLDEEANLRVDAVGHVLSEAELGRDDVFDENEDGVEFSGDETLSSARSPKRPVKLVKAHLADPFSVPVTEETAEGQCTFEFLKFDGGKNDCPFCKQYINDNRNLRTVIKGMESDHQRLRMIIEELCSRLRQVRRVSMDCCPPAERENVDKIFDRLGLLGFLANEYSPNVYERLYQDALERLERLQRAQTKLLEQEAVILHSMSQSRLNTPFLGGEKSFLTEPSPDSLIRTMESWGTKPLKKPKSFWRGRSCSKESVVDKMLDTVESDMRETSTTDSGTQTFDEPLSLSERPSNLPMFSQTATEGLRKPSLRLRSKSSKDSVPDSKWDWSGDKAKLHFATTMNLGESHRPHDIFLGGLVRGVKPRGAGKRQHM
eukprot:GEMP01001319.1.p1 GENE.GEMP01001319.1~~GEMP01001319.1.p1  ORF type:complete len:1358 (+),score=384.19 GEMP01001319.1:73-4146(+)